MYGHKCVGLLKRTLRREKNIRRSVSEALILLTLAKIKHLHFDHTSGVFSVELYRTKLDSSRVPTEHSDQIIPNISLSLHEFSSGSFA